MKHRKVNFELQRSLRQRVGRLVLPGITFLRGAVADALAKAVEFSPDGHWLVTDGTGGNIHRREAGSGR